VVAGLQQIARQGALYSAAFGAGNRRAIASECLENA